MASGNYSKSTLGTGYTNIAAGPASGFTQIVTVSFCNNSASLVSVRLAITTTGVSTPSDTDWLEYDTFINGWSNLERTGIVLANGQILLAQAGTASAIQTQVYGIEGVGNASSGILGRLATAATTWQQLVAAPNSGRIKSVSVSIVNRNATAITFYLAKAGTPTSPSASDYFEANVTLGANGIFERTGIILDSGEGIGIYTSATNVTAVAYGVEDSAT